MGATALIAVPIVAEALVLLPKLTFWTSLHKHLVTFSVRQIICVLAQRLELGPSARFLKS